MSPPPNSREKFRLEGALLLIGIGAVAVGALWSWQAPVLVPAIQDWWSPPPAVVPPTAAVLERRAKAARKVEVEATYLRELAAIRSPSGGRSSYHYWFQIEPIDGAEEEPLRSALWDPLARDWEVASTYTALLREAVAKNARTIDLLEQGIEANCSNRPSGYGFDEPDHHFKGYRAAWRLLTVRDLIFGAPDGGNPYASSALQRLRGTRILRGGEALVVHATIGVMMEREVAETTLLAASGGKFSREEASALATSMVALLAGRQAVVDSAVREEAGRDAELERAATKVLLSNPGTVGLRDFYSMGGLSHIPLTDQEIADRVSTESLRLAIQGRLDAIRAVASASAAGRIDRDREWRELMKSTGPGTYAPYANLSTPDQSRALRAEDLAESRLRMAIAVLVIQATSKPGEPPLSTKEAAKALGIDEKWVVNPYTEKPYELRVVGANRGEIRLDGLRELLDHEHLREPDSMYERPDDWWAFEFPLCPDLAPPAPLEPPTK